MLRSSTAWESFLGRDRPLPDGHCACNAPRTMRKSLLCAAVVAGCASGPTESTASQAEGELCATPPVRCYPLEDSGGFCGLACGNVLAYCPNYPDIAYRFCSTNPYSDKCDQWGFPTYPMLCLMGAPATPPPNADRLGLIVRARVLAGRGQLDEARSLLLRSGQPEITTIPNQ